MTSRGLYSLYNPHQLQSGNGFMDWVNKANNFVKDNQLISKGSNLLGNLGVNVDPRIQMLLELAKKKGYGKRRTKKGNGKRRSKK